MFRLLLFALTLSTVLSVAAQKTEKIPTTLLNGPDGMIVDAEGNIFIANWGATGKGETIVKIDPQGNESVFASGLAAPDGLAFDSNGNLYISCFGSGEIVRINKNGERSVFVSGLDHPSDLKFDKKGNLFVSSFGNFNGKIVYRISAQGKVDTFCKDMQVPLGLAWDAQDRLYVSNFGSPEIFRLNDKGQKELFVSIRSARPLNLQYLAFDSKGNLYCPAYNGGCIYVISPDGTYTTLKLDRSPLDGPNSIFIAGNTLYFTEFNSGSLYKVQL